MEQLHWALHISTQDWQHPRDFLEAGSIKHGHLDVTDCNKGSLRPGQVCDAAPKLMRCPNDNDHDDPNEGDGDGANNDEDENDENDGTVGCVL